MTKESMQLHMHDSFIPHVKVLMTKVDWKKVCDAVSSMKEKKTGEVKGRTCADSGIQPAFIAKEDSTSQEALSTAVMEAMEERKVRTRDTPNVFTQTHSESEEERIILVLCGTAADLKCDIAPFHKEFVVMEKGQKLHIQSVSTQFTELQKQHCHLALHSK